MMTDAGDHNNSTLTGDDAITQAAHDDDDYAMSIPMPVGQGAIVNPNEEPPLPEETAAYEDTVSIYEDGAKRSKFDMRTVVASSPTAASESGSEGAASTATDKAQIKAKRQRASLTALLRNYWGGSKADKSAEETERERKWGEWMRSGRKVRGNSSAADSFMALDDSLPLVDEGADYVLVAVPAEAADGVGPILPSFPGGKRFQQRVREIQEGIVNGDGIGGGGSTGGNATASKGNTAGPAPKASEKKKKKAKPPPPPRKKKKKTDGKHNKQQQQLEEDRARRQKQNRYREPGRISANDWRHNMHNLPSSTILRDVRSPVAWVFVWATLWSVFHRVMTAAATPAAPRWVRLAAGLAGHLSLPTTQHTMMVSAMSFLLVFRTNSAYQRFAEGRWVRTNLVCCRLSPLLWGTVGG